MRRALDALYLGAAYAAALCMVLTLAAVLANIFDRFVAMPLRGLDAYAGYAMAGAGFLALAHTLKRGEHIRVTVVLGAVSPRLRHALELWSLACACVLSGALAWFSVRLVLNSIDYHDISTGNDATPLWIPQLAMAAGTCIFFIAFVDEFVLRLRGVQAPAEAGAALHME